MKFLLVTKDPELYKLCRETLANCSHDWQLLSGEPGASRAPRPFCIWDFHDGLQLPERSGWSDPSRNIFLVHRADLPAFSEQTRHLPVRVLLKPVTQATLASFLNQMTSSVAVSTDAADGSLEAERDALLQCLIEANLKLQEYDQDRTNFLARAVHDFHAPLTAVSGYCGLLLSEPLGPLNEEQKEILRRVQNSAKRLCRMAWAMLQLSVGQAGECELQVEQCDPADCVDQALHEMMPAFRHKDIEFSADMRPSPEPLWCDRAHVEQLLVNLLDNARKFTPRSGSVRISGYPYFWERRAPGGGAFHTGSERRHSAVTAPNSYRFDVQDTGPGIPSSETNRIFESYTRCAGGQDRSGAGLGLAICKTIAERHMGRIWVENGATGSVFSVVFPYEAVQNRPFTVPIDERSQLSRSL